MAFGINAAEYSLVEDWHTPDNWPAGISFTAGESHAELLLVEESGINLKLRDNAGNEANTPGRRIHGPEFFLVKPGDTVRLELAEVFSNSPAGSFRVFAVPLESNALYEAAARLSAAGFDAGSGDPERLGAACDAYADVAVMAGIPAEFNQASAIIAVGCNILAGRASPADLLASLDTSGYPLGLKSYHADWLRGNLAFINEDLAEARASFSLALELAQADLDGNAGPLPGLELDIAALHVSNASVNMFEAWIDGTANGRRMLATAEEQLRYAIDQAVARGDHVIAGSAYDFMAAVEFVRGNEQASFENLLLARDEIRLTNQPQELLAILGSIGDHYKRWGDLKLAQETYLEAARIVQETNSENRAADTFHNLSTLYYTLGDFPRARDMILRARTVYENSGNTFRAKIMNFDLARILVEQGETLQAHDLLRDLLDYLVGQSNPWDPIRIETQSALSNLQQELGMLDSALQLSGEIFRYVEQEREVVTGFELVPVYVTHAKLLAASSNVQQALEILSRTLDSIAVEPAEKIDVYAGMNAIYASLGNTASAIAMADAGFDLIESQQMEIESVRLGPYWNGKMQEFYMAHVDYLLGLDEPAYQAQAFAVVERARATSLRLRRQEMLLDRTREDATARRAWQDMLATIQQASGSPQTDEDTLQLERRISEARERFFLSYADSAARLKPGFYSIDDIAGMLDDQTLVVEYVAGPENVWRYDIGRDGWAVTNIGSTEMVRAGIDAALFELTSRNSATSGNTRYLSSLLLSGIALDGVSRLLVSPSSAMNSIPFSVLEYNGSFLVDRASITMLPSISEFFSNPIPREPEKRELSLAVFADPAFGKVAPGMDLAYTDTDKMRSWSDSLERLPASAIEARALRAFYDDAESLVLTGSEATQQNLFDDRVRNAGIIHIATHGYFNENLPELIGFALASETGSDDGFVSMAEIASQKFSADLVVISACSTARGEIIPGEGSMSLARSFLAQGVNSVVSTLWPVSDSATALFMREFYRAINVERMGYEDALKSAQNMLRESNRYQSPFYWGAYILTSVSRSG